MSKNVVALCKFNLYTYNRIFFSKTSKLIGMTKLSCSKIFTGRYYNASLVSFASLPVYNVKTL